MPAKGRLEWVVKRLPPRLAARIDGLRPGLAAGYSGPMNGQERRLEVVRALFATLEPDLVVETGTHRGTTTVLFRTLTNAPIVTVEAHPRYAAYAHRRLRSQAATRVIHGHSPDAIRRLAHGRGLAARRPFFYLDAHGPRNLPFRPELLEVVSGWAEWCVLVDDFAVPDDPGYGHDDHGIGRALTTDQLAGIDLSGVRAFWPTARSAEETGHRRGMVVLARGDALIEGARTVPGLREDPGLLEGGRLQGHRALVADASPTSAGGGRKRREARGSA